ncbi:MAG: c-type cytochrome, partial [Phycisphaerales bacterium]|nr:c-type cytochrome [Phycisphaerales bacterium]
ASTAVSWLAVGAAGFTGYWLVNTGHLGGLAVYEHGVGTPGMVAMADDAASVETSTTGSSDDVRVTFFVSNVQPVITDNCLRCHGGGERTKARLNLRTIEGMLAGGRSGPAIVPGSPEMSLLMQRITEADPDEVMPPTGDRLSAEEISAIAQWIRDGAAWPASAGS